MLDEVELLVRRRRPEVGPVVGDGVLGNVPISVDHRDRRLLAERGVGEHHVGVDAGLLPQGVVGRDGGLSFVISGANPVEEQVHGAQTAHAVHELDPSECVVPKVLLLVSVEVVVPRDVVVGGEEESSSSTGGVHDQFPGSRLDAVHDGVDQGSRGEVLAGTTFDVLCVPLE